MRWFNKLMNSMYLIIWSVLTIMASTAGVSAVPDIEIKAEPAPEIEALFRQDDGWIGADGDYSIPLDKDTVLWFFSDTFVGKVKDGRRIESTMINNSVGVQKLGKDPSVRYFYGKKADGSPDALITPDEGPGYFWIFHGALVKSGLYLFLKRTISTGGEGAFGFKGIGTTIGHIHNPKDSPDKWKITQSELKHCCYDENRTAAFGSAVLQKNGYVYIYGLDSRTKPDGKRTADMILARVPEESIGDQDQWQFYGKGKWQKDFAACDALCSDMTTEYSVSYLPALKKYVVAHTAGGIWGQIVLRFAPRPEGPWSKPVVVYDCPDKHWHEKAFSYAVKAHPELSASPNELIVTYATNSNNFDDLLNDARLYWPRFVRVTIKAK